MIGGSGYTWLWAGYGYLKSENALNGILYDRVVMMTRGIGFFTLHQHRNSYE